jgi:glycosyltransferase involved in cell wall biosynthesis
LNALRARLVFLSVVPSPYQRDLFATLADRGHVSLQVHYLEAAAPDSPWPVVALAPWENVLAGVTFGRGIWRSHLNWRLPRAAAGEVWVVNGAMTDVTTQLAMRRLGRRTPWAFWGELPSVPRTRARRSLQAVQYAPLRRARAIVAVGARAQAAYATLAPGVATFNQPYTCRLAPFATAAARRVSATEPVFLFCGQMIARKGVDVLLHAFTELCRSGMAARLELVGREGDLPTWLRELPAEVRARVHYAGFKTPAELPAVFAAADVFVLPSRHDGWGVVVNQALGAGLPVICSDAVGAGHDLVQSDVNGIVIPAGDTPALTLAMRRLAEDRTLRNRYGAAASAMAERLAPERAAEFWESLAGQLSATA